MATPPKKVGKLWYVNILKVFPLLICFVLPNLSSLNLIQAKLVLLPITLILMRRLWNGVLHGSSKELVCRKGHARLHHHCVLLLGR